jgi:hypothetical protein
MVEDQRQIGLGDLRGQRAQALLQHVAPARGAGMALGRAARSRHAGFTAP